MDTGSFLEAATPQPQPCLHRSLPPGTHQLPGLPRANLPAWFLLSATWFADQAKIFNSLRTCMQTRSVSHRNAFEELSANDRLEGGRDVCQSPSLHLQPEPGKCEVILLDTVWSWGLGKQGGWGREGHTERKRLGHV